MSRMASMQVLNQAFANANAAFNAYMRNKNEERRSDLAEEFGRLDRQYRAEQALQQQANLDRMYELATARDAQAQSNADRSFYANQAAATRAQENWQKTFDANNRTADSTRRTNGMRMLANILKVAPDAGTAETMINQMGAGFDDPIEQGAFLTDWYKRKAQNDINTQWSKQLSDFNKMKLAKLASQQKALEARNKLDLEYAKMRQSEQANDLKNAIPFINAARETADRDNPFNMGDAIAEYNALKAYLNGGLQAQATSKLTATDLEAKVKSGELTREQAYNIAKQNGLLK